ncbi:MAG: hypothetical protein EAX96_12155 [Candidatus Lokiarchaeota archaeon]|nr:hypothetical protein [Candidatus Lokiarchaeota archaeon]
MTIRILLSECHDEIISSQNTNSFQTMLNGMDCAVFPYVEGPILFENIQDDDILILGCPQSKLSSKEIDDIERFILRGKKVLLISGNLGDSFYNSNLSELARRFDLEFNENQVENYKENEDSPSIIVIRHFESIIFSNKVYQIIYSGCTINLLENSCKALARSSIDSTPPAAPVIAMSKNERVYLFGGFNLFIDEPKIGIQSHNNFEFIINFFDHLLNLIKQEKEMNPPEQLEIESEDQNKMDEGFSFDIEIKSIEDDHDIKILGIINGDITRLNPKKADEKFQIIINMFIEYLEQLEDKIDKFWAFIRDKINTNDPEIIYKAKISLQETYNEFCKEINRISGLVNDQHVDFCSNFEKKYFDPQGSLVKWFEAEAELREHLDMIRNNLLALFG